MWGLSRATRVFLRSGPTDLRLGFDGLAAVVKTQLAQDLLAGSLFVFCNSSKTRIKILCFDGSGLWLCTKRLERGTFAWPKSGPDEIESAALHALLAGLEVKGRRKWFRK
jgi:transposase